MPEWVSALILPSAIVIAGGLLFKFVPFKTYGKMLSLLFGKRLGVKTGQAIEGYIHRALDEFQAGMKEDDK